MSVSTVSAKNSNKDDNSDNEEAQSSEGSSASNSASDVDRSSDNDEATVSNTESLAKRRKITGHHRKGGVSASWLKEYPWLRSDHASNGKAGMRCHLCTKHSIIPRSGSSSWTTELCFSIRKDKVVKHAKSKMHKQAEVMEASLQAGGIPQAFDESYALEIKAAIAWMLQVHILVV